MILPDAFLDFIVRNRIEVLPEDEPLLAQIIIALENVELKNAREQQRRADMGQTPREPSPDKVIKLRRYFRRAFKPFRRDDWQTSA